MHKKEVVDLSTDKTEAVARLGTRLRRFLCLRQSPSNGENDTARFKLVSDL